MLLRHLAYLSHRKFLADSLSESIFEQSDRGDRSARLFLPIRFLILCSHGYACQEAKIAFDERQLDQREIVERQFLVACRDGATLFQPAHTLLDGTASMEKIEVLQRQAA